MAETPRELDPHIDDACVKADKLDAAMVHVGKAVNGRARVEFNLELIRHEQGPG